LHTTDDAILSASSSPWTAVRFIKPLGCSRPDQRKLCVDMASALPHPPALPRSVATLSGALSLLGLAGLMLTVLFGFETPNTALVATSGALTFAVPLAVLWHFAATRTLTTA